MLVTIVLDDSYGGGTGGGFADAAGAAANLTDFTVNYNSAHPDLPVRLLHGRTLQSGKLSAIDTCT